jgi:hypothetical protein
MGACLRQAVEQKCFSTILFAFREPNQVHLKEQGALGPTRHGFHFHILCGVLHRLSFWIRRAGINFANSKAASTPTAAVPQLFEFEPADAFRGAASRAYDRLTTPIAPSRTSLHASCGATMNIFGLCFTLIPRG